MADLLFTQVTVVVYKKKDTIDKFRAIGNVLPTIGDELGSLVPREYMVRGVDPAELFIEEIWEDKGYQELGDIGMFTYVSRYDEIPDNLKEEDLKVRVIEDEKQVKIRIPFNSKRQNDLFINALKKVLKKLFGTDLVQYTYKSAYSYEDWIEAES